jgi:fermentation-respiration switch protein FrsA (DUF1100 family)
MGYEEPTLRRRFGDSYDAYARQVGRWIPRLQVLLLSIVLIVALSLIQLWAIQRQIIYVPFGDVPTPAQVGLPQAEAVTFPTDDGLTLNGWFVPAHSPRAAATVIIFNGNAGNRSFRAPLAARLAEEGFASLLFDYRGFGGNPGSPSEQGLTLDARAARRYVESRADVDAHRIVYFGGSLGTGVAVRLAVEHRPHALILRSPFTSLVDVARHHYPFLPVALLLRDKFSSIDQISRIGCPLLIIAAEGDTMTPASQSRRLFAAASEPKCLQIFEHMDHNDEALLAGPEAMGAITTFLRGLE